MKKRTYNSAALIAVLMSTLLLLPTGTFAQGPAATPPPEKNRQAPKEKGPLIRKRAKSLTRFQQDWTNKVLNSAACIMATPGEACKDLAAMQISVSCADYAQFYQNEASVWNVATFALVLVSAGFTGVGASATIASSTKLPKIFSTLGGTTGLGAVTTLTKANVSTDLSGIAAENALAVKLQTLLKDPATDYKAILAQGPAIVLQCATAGGTAAPAAAGAGGAPGAPTIGTATATSVAFTGRPASEGVTLYTATASPGGKTWTGTSSPITVTGLTAGTYTFTVTATSAGGAGPASQPSNSVIVP